MLNPEEIELALELTTNKADWIGGKIIDRDMGMELISKITDITMKRNGDDSYYITVKSSKDQGDCGTDLSYGSVIKNEDGSITITRYIGGYFTIRKPT